MTPPNAFWSGCRPAGSRPRTRISPEVPQHHLECWRFIWSVRKRRVLLLGDSPEPPAEDGYRELTEDVVWIDAGLRWALADDGVFWWLGHGKREVNST